MPHISICIPTYNGEAFIETCLDSVLSQSYDDFEVILVDDCSLDTTPEILQHYAQLDPRIRVFTNQHNIGLVGNWNRCIELSAGEWIKFIFQDDYLLPRCLEEMMRVVDASSHFLVCDREFIFEGHLSQRMLDTYQNCPQLSQIVGHTRRLEAREFCLLLQEMESFWYWNFIGEPSTVMFRKDLVRHLGFFAANLIQQCDHEYWLRIGCNYGITSIPQKLAAFRVHENSCSSAQHRTKSFEIEYLDSLVLLHELLVQPYYTNLRNTFQEGGRLTWLKKLLAGRLKSARHVVMHSEDPRIQLQYQHYQELYPVLQLIEQRYKDPVRTLVARRIKGILKKIVTRLLMPKSIKAL